MIIQQKFYEFNATIMNTKRKGHIYSYIELPFQNLQNEFGSKEMIPIKITFDNITHSRGMISSDCAIPYFIIIDKIKNQLQKEIGDTIHINLQYDNEPQEIKIPKYLLKSIFSNCLLNQWEELTTANKKEFIIQWKKINKENIEDKLNFFIKKLFERKTRIR